MTAPRGRRGSATMLTLAVIVLVAGVLTGLVRLGDAAHAAARTEAIADVAALAAVGGGRPAAVAVADASGGALVDLVDAGDDGVRVTVRRDHVVRAAAARAVRVNGDGRRDPTGG